VHKCLLIVVALLIYPADGKVASPKEIFKQNQGAVVRIFVNGTINGCGFIVSEAGLVVTANHVIAEADEAKGGIMIERIGSPKQVHASLTDHSESTDTALLQMPGGGLPHTQFGDTASSDVSETVTVITFWPTGKVPILLTGVISNVAVDNTKGIIFQMPVRKGYSGSPIFNSHGQVIGIVTTRLVGITDDLDKTRKTAFAQGTNGGGTIVDGVDVLQTFGKLISAYDLDLISGMGTAVSTSYAEEMIEKKGKELQK
jgi:S1-C subfamily serine protease